MTDDIDGAEYIDFKTITCLLIGQFFHTATDSIPSIIHDYIYLTEGLMCLPDGSGYTFIVVQ